MEQQRKNKQLLRNRRRQRKKQQQEQHGRVPQLYIILVHMAMTIVRITRLAITRSTRLENIRVLVKKVSSSNVVYQ